MTASFRRLWIQITADRKRFGVLCATFGMGLLLWARLIIVSQVPRTAMADQGKTAATTDGSGAVGANKSDKGAGSATDKPASKDGGRGATKTPRVIEVRLSNQSERDPFVISPLHFPKTSARPEVKQEAGKLPTEPAEDSSTKEAREAARFRQLLGPMKLEAVMGNSMAVIDGRKYRVGDLLPVLGSERVQFTLVEVRPRSAVLECQGRRFELEMSLPG